MVVKNKVCRLVVKCAVYVLLTFYLFLHIDFEWVKLLLSGMDKVDKPRKYAI